MIKIEEVSVCGDRINEIRGSARARFKEMFGCQEKEQRAFNLALNTLIDIYRKDSKQLKQRIEEILLEGYNRAADLAQYLGACRIAEGRDSLSYEEIIKIIGVVPLKIGEPLYHFSNKQHKIGYEGHRGMCLSTSNDLGSVVANVDLGNEIYRHTCIIRNPSLLLDHDAKTLYKNKVHPIKIIEEFLLDSPRRKIDRWFEVKKKGAISVYSIDRV